MRAVSKLPSRTETRSLGLGALRLAGWVTIATFAFPLAYLAWQSTLGGEPLPLPRSWVWS